MILWLQYSLDKILKTFCRLEGHYIIKAPTVRVHVLPTDERKSRKAEYRGLACDLFLDPSSTWHRPEGFVRHTHMTVLLCFIFCFSNLVSFYSSFLAKLICLVLIGLFQFFYAHARPRARLIRFVSINWYNPDVLRPFTREPDRSS